MSLSNNSEQRKEENGERGNLRSKHLYLASLSFCFHWFVSRFSYNSIKKLRINFESDMDKRILASYFTSLAHSSLSTILLLRGVKSFRTCIAKAATSSSKILAECPVDGTLYCASLSLGYFCFDLLDMLDFWRPLPMDFVIHHVVVAWGCLAVILPETLYQPFFYMALCAEPNTIFLSSRMIFKMLGLQEHRLFRTILWPGLFITFVFSRIVVHGIATFFSLKFLAEARDVKTKLMGIGGSISALSIMYLNQMLLRRLWNSDKKLLL